MNYTKSQRVLDLLEDFFDRANVALLDQIEEETGWNFFNEEQFSDDDLLDIINFGEQYGAVYQYEDAGYTKYVPPPGAGGGHTIGSVYHAAKEFVKPHLATAGTKVGQGLQHVSSLAQAHPVAAGAAALGAGALLALRARKNAKARAIAAKA